MFAHAKLIKTKIIASVFLLQYLFISQALAAVGQKLSVSLIPNAPQLVNSVLEFEVQTTGGTGALQYQWDFGDGSAFTGYSLENVATHAYLKPGRFTVIAHVKDASGTEKTTSFIQAVYTQATTSQPTNTSSIVYEAANQRVWNVNPDNNTVTVIDAATNNKLREIRVGKRPRSLAISPNGLVAVVNQRSHDLSLITANDLQLMHTVALPFASQPYGILFDRTGAFAYVTLAATGQLLKINASTGEADATLYLGGNPRHMAMTGDGQKLYVTRYVTAPVTDEHTVTPNPQANEGGEVTVIDLENFKVASRVYLQADLYPDSPVSARGIPNYLGAPVISPDGRFAWVPSKEDNIFRGLLRDGQPLDFAHTLRAVTSKLDLTSDQEIFTQRIDHNDAGLATAGVFEPNGNYLFIALETSREIAVIDAYTGSQLFRFFTEYAPQGLALSDDGRHLYVHNYMSRSVTAYGLMPLIKSGAQAVRRLKEVKTVSNERLSNQVLRGKQLFFDALDDRLARDNYLSCASCHQDGGQDGRVWDMTSLGEGLRNTIALSGRSGVGHGLLQWAASFDEIQDFEAQIRTLAEGTGLMADIDFNQGTRQQPLGDTKTGLSTDLDALASYLGSLNTFEPSPYRTDEDTLSNMAIAGKSVFINQCAACHRGLNFTNSGTVNELVNMGTIKSSSGSRLGQRLNALDVPTLRDVWATAPYLHDGSAKTLQAAINAHDGLNVSNTTLMQVIAYINEIGNGESDGVQPSNSRTPNVVLKRPESKSSNVSGSIEAIANDPDGTITKVEFYYNALLLETITQPPYVFSWENVPNGSYPIIAKAHDNSGAVAISNAVTLLVDNQGNIAPTVVLQTPQGLSGLTSGSIEAIAGDADGHIQRVEFYYDGDLVGTFTNAPYVLTWHDVPSGDYKLTAKAYDNAGAVTTSHVVVVSVTSDQ